MFSSLAEAARQKATQMAQAASRLGQETLSAARSTASHTASFMGSSSATALVGQELSLAGRQFLVEALLGEGGFASVYLASLLPPRSGGGSAAAPPGMKVVIKKMFASGNELTAQLSNEVKLMQQLQPHPNIVKVFGAETRRIDSSSVDIYVIMEFCPGGHLLSRLNALSDAGKYLPPDRIVDAMLGIARPVAHMHAQAVPVAHRDLKFENVLLAADGSLRLCDFGSASAHAGPIRDKADRAEQEDAITRFTTPTFRAPEMLDLYLGVPLDVRSDVWALGCMAYGLAYLRHPFQEAGTLGILSARYRIPATPAVPPPITLLIKACLQIHPENRPTAAGVVAYLERVKAALPAGGPWPPLPSSCSPSPHWYVCDAEAVAAMPLGGPSTVLPPNAPPAGAYHVPAAGAAAASHEHVAHAAPTAAAGAPHSEVSSAGGAPPAAPPASAAAPTAAAGGAHHAPSGLRPAVAKPTQLTAAEIAAQVSSAGATGPHSALAARLARRGGAPAPVVAAAQAPAAPVPAVAPAPAQVEPSPSAAAAAPVASSSSHVTADDFDLFGTSSSSSSSSSGAASIPPAPAPAADDGFDLFAPEGRHTSASGPPSADTSFEDDFGLLSMSSRGGAAPPLSRRASASRGEALGVGSSSSSSSSAALPSGGAGGPSQPPSTSSSLGSHRSSLSRVGSFTSPSAGGAPLLDLLGGEEGSGEGAETSPLAAASFGGMGHSNSSNSISSNSGLTRPPHHTRGSSASSAAASSHNAPTDDVDLLLSGPVPAGPAKPALSLDSLYGVPGAGMGMQRGPMMMPGAGGMAMMGGGGAYGGVMLPPGQMMQPRPQAQQQQAAKPVSSSSLTNDPFGLGF